jgi:hypothetical protein
MHFSEHVVYADAALVKKRKEENNQKMCWKRMVDGSKTVSFKENRYARDQLPISQGEVSKTWNCISWAVHQKRIFEIWASQKRSAPMKWLDFHDFGNMHRLIEHRTIVFVRHPINEQVCLEHKRL